MEKMHRGQKPILASMIKRGKKCNDIFILVLRLCTAFPFPGDSQVKKEPLRREYQLESSISNLEVEKLYIATVVTCETFIFLATFFVQLLQLFATFGAT